MQKVKFPVFKAAVARFERKARRACLRGRGTRAGLQRGPWPSVVQTDDGVRRYTVKPCVVMSRKGRPGVRPC